jgi:hypothetical protein
MEQNQEGFPMAVASLSRRSRQSRATSSTSGASRLTLQAVAAPPKKESITDRIARYKKQAAGMNHEQRGTDEAVNKDSAKRYENWNDLRKKATRA